MRGGCSDDAGLRSDGVAEDLSSASLAPTGIEVCSRRHCDTITMSAELLGTGRFGDASAAGTPERDGTCTFTYSDSGERQFATGSITCDGATVDADGSIFSSKTTFIEPVPMTASA